jgi:MFS transporter, FSR family, fosmidomycin resistance protein
LETAATQPANIKAIALVSGAHLYSHLFIFLLPPLFPLIKEDMGVGYTELAFAIAVFNIVTALTQAPVGFLVDRIGARTLLVAALIVESLALVMVGLMPSYPLLLVMMAVAGLANAVFHPADYVILNASVSDSRMGRAFSVHTASGFFGGFLGPALAIPIAAMYSWNVAVAVLAASGIVMATIVIAGSGVLRDQAQGARSAQGESSGGGLALLLSAPMLIGFLFYAGLSAYGQAFGSFSTSALSSMYDEPLTTLGVVLGLYLFASPVGVLCGGWIADKITAHDRFTAGCIIGMTIVTFIIAAVDLPLWLLGALFTVAGWLFGVLSPSRDMLIRRMTPPSQMGKVFGFVTTGFNAAGIVGPPVFGYLLDLGEPTLVYWAAGILCLLTIPTVMFTGARGRQFAATANA